MVAGTRRARVQHADVEQVSIGGRVGADNRLGDMLIGKSAAMHRDAKLGEPNRLSRDHRQLERPLREEQLQPLLRRRIMVTAKQHALDAVLRQPPKLALDEDLRINVSPTVEQVAHDQQQIDPLASAVPDQALKRPPRPPRESPPSVHRRAGRARPSGLPRWISAA